MQRKSACQSNQWVTFKGEDVTADPTLFTTEEDQSTDTGPWATWRKEGRGTAQGLSTDTKDGGCSTVPWKNILHDSPLWIRDAVMLKKHATGSLSETEGQRNQPPDDAEVTFTKRQLTLRRSPQTDYFIYLFFFFYLFQKTLTSVLGFSKIWILTLRERRKNRFQRATIKVKTSYIAGQCITIRHF